MTRPDEIAALADEYEAGTNKALASGYEEYGPDFKRKRQIVIDALRSYARLSAPSPGDVMRPPSMPPTSDRRWLDEKKDYLESDQDWARDNAEAVEWLADNHAAIRAALAPAEKSGYDARLHENILDQMGAPAEKKFDADQEAMMDCYQFGNVGGEGGTYLQDAGPAPADSGYLLEWCQKHPLDAAAEIEKLRRTATPTPPSGDVAEAKRLIGDRLADLAKSNEIYERDNRLSAPDNIARNNREISWLKDLRSILSIQSAAHGGGTEGGEA